ncbi:MAG: putative polymerase subfamily sigma factor [Acidimicrobiales bacterium]|nr:putative polymerase subfamily sigma factor [Acidimicrobiales bacterium]
MVAGAAPVTGDGDTGASLVQAAAEGLAGRDRILWELSATSTLTGAELAAAVDVPPSQIYTVLNRMRRRAWRAMAAVLLVESGAGHCPGLAHVLNRCEDAFSPLVRKRVARHLDRCARCHAEVAGRLDGFVDHTEAAPAQV